MIICPTPITEQIKILYKIYDAVMKKRTSTSPKIVAAIPTQNGTVVQENQVEEKN